jgi:glycine cleavage system H protein
MKFTKEHEWVDVAGNVATIGITDFAQGQLGDIVSIDLPKVGRDIKAGKEIAMVDSMKASSPVYAPVSGKVVEINANLQGAPQTMNKSPHKDGWIVKIQLADVNETEKLMTEEQYKKFLEESK